MSLLLQKDRLRKGKQLNIWDETISRSQKLSQNGRIAEQGKQAEQQWFEELDRRVHL